MPFDRGRIRSAICKAAASTGGFGVDEAERLTVRAEARIAESYVGQVPTVEDVQDMVESVLMESGHLKTARAYIIYRHRRSELREARQGSVEATDNVPYKLIYDVLRWNVKHGCESISGLNQIITNGAFPEFVQLCEARYASECRSVAEVILRREDPRLVIVAGPSSSGKTTTTIKLGEILAQAGLKLKALNVDHYFLDLNMHPKDEFGDYDYETPLALDIPLINQHLQQLLAGETVQTPHYDFHTGTRTADVHEIQLADDEMLLMDCLHGLHPAMTQSVPDSLKFRLYIETFGQLRNEVGEFMRWTDHRLLRRMIRDSWHRSHDPMFTLSHWHYVRKSELQHIIPFIGDVDAVINSAMPYEFPVLKHRILHHFPEALVRYKEDLKRQDAYLRARRISQFLAPLNEYDLSDCIPANSLFREFIGGSEYCY